MKISAILLVNLIALCCVAPSFAEGASEGLGLKIAQVQKNNAALMHQYTWNSRTELIEQNNLRDIRIEKLSYGVDGRIVRTPMNDFGAPLPLGFLRRVTAEADRKKAEKYMIGLEKFLDQYTLPMAGKVLDFVSKAQIPPSDTSGRLKLTGSSVVVPGDSISVWADATTLNTTTMEVSTFFEGDIVVITSTFNTLPNGPTYVAYTEATITLKQVRLQVHNYDYIRIASPPSPPIEERQLSPSIINWK